MSAVGGPGDDACPGSDLFECVFADSMGDWMTIEIKASDVRDARAQLCGQDAPISIRWRYKDFGRSSELGCIVNAVAMGEEVERVFDNPGDACQYIMVLLTRHDDYVNKDEYGIPLEKGKNG